MSVTPSSNQLLGETAFWTAAVRARETNRPDRLFADPWAEALAGTSGAAWLARRTEESTAPIVLRTRYFDEVLLQAVTAQAIRQVVLVAAGLDTRAYRLVWPEGTRLFELDQPAVLDYKERTLAPLGAQPSCERRPVGTDLVGDWAGALTAAGFDPQEHSAWLLEGFLFYLPDESIERLLESVSNLAAPGSWLGFDAINRQVLTSPYTKAWIDMQAAAGAPWIGALDDPEGFLTARGWNVSMTQAGQPEVNHGRWVLPVIPTKMPNMPHNWLVTANKIS